MAVDIDYSLKPSELKMMEKLLPEFYNSSTVGGRLMSRNWETDFRHDMITGKGFVVTAKPFKKKIKDKEGNILNRGAKEMNGIHSPRFGADSQDEESAQKRYSCERGCTIGKVFKGQRCKECGTKVKLVGVDLKIFAWLKIVTDFRIIQPLMYRKLDSLMGKGVLAQIIDFKKKMNLDGYYYIDENEITDKNPFAGIGMVEFYDRFDEIMEWFKKKRKNKKELFDMIMDEKDCIFTQSVPVYSAVLRQVFFTEEDYSYTKVDKKYNALYGNFSKLNEEVHGLTNMNITKVNKTLHKAQININTAFELIFVSINEREGLIRRNISGGKVNMSARNVIVPDDTLRSFQIRMPYVGFIELYKEEIINLLVRLTGVSYNVAVDEWFEGYCAFSPKIYNIMKYLIKHSKHGVPCLLNRNPSINDGSYLCMEIASVKKDYDDLSCSIPISILTALNADFDGDVLNIISMKSTEFKVEFKRQLSTRNRFMIDHNTGLFNTPFGLIKDQVIGLRYFCEV